ncbi:MAG TPA: hypothetical protein VIV11_06020 [Kofleriaceae bacterium]
MASWRLVIAGATLVACGGPDPFDAMPLERQGLALCTLCTSDTDCTTGVCRMYGDGYRKCSHTCSAGSAAPECPPPQSTGACNLMGYCMCAPYQPPMDACAGYCDAPMAPIDAAMVPLDAPMAPIDVPSD